MEGPVVILSNAGSEEEAIHIAQTLVREFLAASVNVIPGVHSVYRWGEQIEQAEEWMMVIKTTQECADRAIRRLTDLHSYEVPAAIILPIEGGHPPYLNWIDANVESTWRNVE